VIVFNLRLHCGIKPTGRAAVCLLGYSRQPIMAGGQMGCKLGIDMYPDSKWPIANWCNISKISSIAALTVFGVFFFTNTISFAQTAAKQARLYDIGIYVTNLDRTAVFYEKVFGFKIVRRWDTMTNRVGDGPEKEISLSGMFAEDSIGNKFEFLQQGNSESRQVSQQPINHFSLSVEDINLTLNRALAAGARLAFPDIRTLHTKIGNLSVEHTQVIGLDGERIQIIQELNP
jgi:catechol 2,3-dioxygenase-like lactoylglutathione lyase family enzyme